MKLFEIKIYNNIFILMNYYEKNYQEIIMFENRILMNCEKRRNLKSKEFYPLIELAIYKALFLYFYKEKAKTLIFTFTKW
jgi:hypothetical protein